MKIVIEIPEEFMRDWEASRFSDCIKRVRSDFNHIASPYRMAGKYEIETLDMLQIAFKNGILLPEGHGRLIDADALKKESVMCPTVGNSETLLLDIWNVEHAPTIIEADKEGAEE